MIYSFFSFFPFTVCLFWTAVFLLEWRDANPAKRTLTVFMAVCTVLYLCHSVFFNVSGDAAIRDVADSVYVFCNLAVFPLYLIYIFRLTSRRPLSLRTWLLLVPAVVIALCNCAATFVPSLYGLHSAVAVVAKVLFLVQLLPICYVGSKRLRAFDREVANYFSSTEERSVTLTRHMMMVLCVCTCCSIVVNIIGREHFLSNSSLLVIPSLFFGVTLFAVGYAGQKQAFCADDIPERQEAPDVPKPSRLLQDIETIMRAEQLYLLPDLRLSDVAKRLGIGRATISSCINQEAGMSFSDYINNMRIDYAMEIMGDRQKAASMSIIHIAEQCGFSSESSFYRAFKKKCDLTPKQWLERL